MTTPAARVDQLIAELQVAIKSERTEGSTKVAQLQAELDAALAVTQDDHREELWKDPHFIPKRDQVGLTLDDWAKMTDWNDPKANDTLISTPIDIGHHKKVHGRLRFESAGAIRGDRCLLDGPEDPTIATGETAILDGDKPCTERSLLTNSVIYMKHPHPRWNAFKGSNFDFKGCHMFGVTDGIGPYTKQGQTYATEVGFAYGIIEMLCYWPGDWWANRDPKYWNGSAYVVDKLADWKRGGLHGSAVDRLGFFDVAHGDGCHCDPCEIHAARGRGTLNKATMRWDSTGVYLHNAVLAAYDAYGEVNPTPLPLVLPPSWGYGDSPRAGYEQKPGKLRPVPAAERTKKQADGRYSANGTSLYIGQVTGDSFEDITSVVCHDLLLDGGNMQMQFQKKNLPEIRFTAYDLRFTRNVYRWSADNTRDSYPVRVNDYLVANQMPNFDKPPVIIARHPITGLPAHQSWVFDDNSQPLPLGSSTVAGIRVN